MRRAGPLVALALCQSYCVLGGRRAGHWQGLRQPCRGRLPAATQAAGGGAEARGARGGQGAAVAQELPAAAEPDVAAGGGRARAGDGVPAGGEGGRAGGQAAGGQGLQGRSRAKEWGRRTGLGKQAAVEASGAASNELQHRAARLTLRMPRPAPHSPPRRQSEDPDYKWALTVMGFYLKFLGGLIALGISITWVVQVGPLARTAPLLLAGPCSPPRRLPQLPARAQSRCCPSGGAGHRLHPHRPARHALPQHDVRQVSGGAGPRQRQ